MFAFEMHPRNSENYRMMKAIIDEYLQRYDTIIMRGTLGESGMSLYKTNSNDTSEIYQEISDSGEKVVIVEPFLNVSSSPNDQWIISRIEVFITLAMRIRYAKKAWYTPYYQ